MPGIEAKGYVPDEAKTFKNQEKPEEAQISGVSENDETILTDLENTVPVSEIKGSVPSGDPDKTLSEDLVPTIFDTSDPEKTKFQPNMEEAMADTHMADESQFANTQAEQDSQEGERVFNIYDAYSMKKSSDKPEEKKDFYVPYEQSGKSAEKDASTDESLIDVNAPKGEVGEGSQSGSDDSSEQIKKLLEEQEFERQRKGIRRELIGEDDSQLNKDIGKQAISADGAFDKARFFPSILKNAEPEAFNKTLENVYQELISGKQQDVYFNASEKLSKGEIHPTVLEQLLANIQFEDPNDEKNVKFMQDVKDAVKNYYKEEKGIDSSLPPEKADDSEKFDQAA